LPRLNTLDDPTNSPVVHTFDAVDGGDRSNEFVPRGTDGLLKDLISEVAHSTVLIA
jgi:hypothetical protein